MKQFLKIFLLVVFGFAQGGFAQGIKITNLPSSHAANNADLFYVVQRVSGIDSSFKTRRDSINAALRRAGMNTLTFGFGFLTGNYNGSENKTANLDSSKIVTQKALKDSIAAHAGIQSVVGGNDISVDITDPQNPVIDFIGNSTPLNHSDTRVPNVNDDIGDGYTVFSLWRNSVTKLAWMCMDASSGAAVWRLITIGN